jgi:hypothetical protein
MGNDTKNTNEKAPFGKFTGGFFNTASEFQKAAAAVSSPGGFLQSEKAMREEYAENAFWDKYADFRAEMEAGYRNPNADRGITRAIDAVVDGKYGGSKDFKGLQGTCNTNCVCPTSKLNQIAGHIRIAAGATAYSAIEPKDSGDRAWYAAKAADAAGRGNL